MKNIPFIFLLLSLFSYSQNRLGGIVLDFDEKSPLEFVGIYNDKDRTMTNGDGKFLFSSSSDSITFYRPGYDKQSTTFQKVKDTTYLLKSVLHLNEVTVTNEKTLWQKVKDSLESNYALYPFKEKFLLRGVLRYNGKIMRIQDIQGKLQRKTLLYTQEIEPGKKDFSVEITNMRKVGIELDENKIYFIFDSFNELFMNLIPMNATGEAFELTESSFENEKKIKLSFQLLPSYEKENTYGHYVINTENNAVEQFYLVAEFKDTPFQKSQKTRYRTIFVKRETSLSQSPINLKYYITSSKYNARVEQTDEDRSYTSFYDVSFVMTTTDNEGEFDISKNVSTTKDLFRIKHSYNADYWNSQNQLLLTNEMLDFIEKVQDSENEFKIRSNIKD